MKMKKFFAMFFMAAIFCFAFVGCGENTQPPSDADQDNTDSTEQLPPDTDSGNPAPQLPPTTDENDSTEITEMYLTINGNKLKVKLEKNTSVDALVAILKQGDITYTADDYGGFEKVGYLGHTLPTNNSQITTSSGDVILYSGNQIVLFYGSNSWSYTRLGKIEGYSVAQLRSLLGAGEGKVQVVISLK